MVRRLAIVCVVVAAALNQPLAQTRLACLGTSITHIGNFTDPLAQLLGNAYILDNWGIDGTTIMVDCTSWLGGSPGRTSQAPLNVINSKPDVCVLEFGANDVAQWGQVGSCFRVLDARDKFVHDYNLLLDTLVHNISPVPRMFICLPTPNFTSTQAGLVLRDSVIPAIRDVAAARNIPVIDNYTPLVSHPEYFHDGLHPTAAGGQAMANIVYHAITATTATMPATPPARAVARGRLLAATGVYDIHGRLLRAGTVRGLHGRLLFRDGVVRGCGQ
jgi:lysophospholipase L1-like esterase